MDELGLRCLFNEQKMTNDILALTLFLVYVLSAILTKEKTNKSKSPIKSIFLEK